MFYHLESFLKLLKFAKFQQVFLNGTRTLLLRKKNNIKELYIQLEVSEKKNWMDYVPKHFDRKDNYKYIYIYIFFLTRMKNLGQTAEGIPIRS